MAVPVGEPAEKPKGLHKLVVFLRMIRFEHTVFALPFAYFAAFMAAGGLPTARQILWITLAMIGARTAALSLNAIIDRHIDAKNPRTKDRALPRGILSTLEVWFYALASFVLLGVSAWMLNPLCFFLLPVAVFALVIYPYTKRWTWACHLILGAVDGLAPLGAWVAITGSMDLPGVLLWAAIGLWVAGFDLIYATADVDFDRSFKVFSIPARFGLKAALNVSSLLHLGAFFGLLVAGVLVAAGLFYWIGLAVALVLMVYQHMIVSPEDLSRSGVAFFNLNGYLSVMMFVAVLMDSVF